MVLTIVFSLQIARHLLLTTYTLNVIVVPFLVHPSLVGPAANTGIVVTGSGANVVVSGGVVGVCTTGIHVTNNAVASINSVSFRINAFDIVQDGASHLTLAGCTFELTNSSADIDIQISGAGTTANIIGCEFNGDSTGGVPEGIGMVISIALLWI